VQFVYEPPHSKRGYQFPSKQSANVFRLQKQTYYSQLKKRAYISPKTETSLFEQPDQSRRDTTTLERNKESIRASKHRHQSVGGKQK